MCPKPFGDIGKQLPNLTKNVAATKNGTLLVKGLGGAQSKLNAGVQFSQSTPETLLTKAWPTRLPRWFGHQPTNQLREADDTAKQWFGQNDRWAFELSELNLELSSRRGSKTTISRTQTPFSRWGRDELAAII